MKSFNVFEKHKTSIFFIVFRNIFSSREGKEGLLSGAGQGRKLKSCSQQSGLVSKGQSGSWSAVRESTTNQKPARYIDSTPVLTSVQNYEIK